MPRLILDRLALAAVASLIPTLAFAHTGIGPTVGFSHGFLHPIMGLDHVLAMVMVGMFAAQLGGRALWLVPCAFVGVMALGGALGVAGFPLPYVEIGIALSVVVLGALVAFGVRLPTAIAMAVVALFALFHGHAHGSEMPETAAGLNYGLGFIAATGLLHAAGVGLGLLLGGARSANGTAVARTAGGLAAIAGLALLTGII